MFVASLDFGQCLAGDWSAIGTSTLQDSLLRRVGEFARGTHLILLSDLLSPHEPQKVLRVLRERVQHCSVIQILSEQDWNFELGDVVQMQDSETGEVVELSIDAKSIEQYQHSL